MNNTAKMAAFPRGKQSTDLLRFASCVPLSEQAPSPPLQMFVFTLHTLGFYFIFFRPVVFFILLLCHMLSSVKRPFKACISG